MLVNGYDVPDDYIGEDKRFAMTGLFNSGGPTAFGNYLTESIFSGRSASDQRPSLFSKSDLLECFLPHRVYFLFDNQDISTVAGRHPNEVFQWLQENNNSIWAFWIGGFYFADPTDAVAFKMRWG